MKSEKRPYIVVICLLAVMVLFLGSFFVVTILTRSPQAADGGEKLSELMGMIEEYSYDEESNEESLYLAAARGMVASLNDDYAEYYTAEEYAEKKQVKSGKYKGIGVSFTQEGENFVIVKVNEDGPAERAGIQQGDIIHTIDGKTLKGLDTDDISAMIKEFEGEFEMGLIRDGEEFTVTLKTEEIQTKRVYCSMLEGNIAYIMINAFYNDCSTAFPKALDQALEKGAEALILDLRGNLGGELTEMMAVADCLIDGKVVLTTKNGDGTEEVYTASAGAVEIPIVVLVDGNSASASEALSGALQDYGIAKLVGTKTYGKGIVQTTYYLSKSEGWVKMTTGAYFTPNGACIHGVGLTPDVVVPGSAGDPANPDVTTDAQLRAAVRLLNGE